MLDAFWPQNSEKNARLLKALAQAMGAQDYGAIHNFFAVEEMWRCPCCYRTKAEIATIDKNGSLCCRLVMHHDHFTETFPSVVPINSDDRVDYSAIGAVRDSFQRFPETLICEHCNNADAAAKRIVEAPPQFSFAPYEIAGFIDVEPNRPHSVDLARAHAAFDAARPTMTLIAQRLRAVKRQVEGSNDFEPVAQAANRVLAGVRLRRDRKGSV